jgi:hypothetical protein
LKCCASAMANAVLPTAVGPVTIIQTLLSIEKQVI